MSRKRNVIRFWRGARRHSKWDLGAPPNPRGKSSYRPAARRGGWGKVFIAAIALVLLGPPTLDAASLAWRENDGCKIWMVVDGDTVRMYCPVSGFQTGRILAYDTPEFKARCLSELGKAVAATFYLRWMIWTAAEVSARTEGTDRYGRKLTLLLVDGMGVARPMVQAGLARWYEGGHRRGWCGSDA